MRRILHALQQRHTIHKCQSDENNRTAGINILFGTEKDGVLLLLIFVGATFGCLTFCVLGLSGCFFAMKKFYGQIYNFIHSEGIKSCEFIDLSANQF